MWGSWYTLLVGGLVVFAVVLSFAVGASPLFALLIFAFAALVIGGVALARRGAAGARSAPASGEALRGRDASGAPAAGEGGPPPTGQ